MAKLIKQLTLTLTIGLLAFNSSVLAKTSNLTFKKDQVADFLFLTDREDGKPLKKQYFADIGPAAVAMGYQNTTAFRITRNPVSGQYIPRVLAIASWPGDWQQRQAFFSQLVEEKPDIAERRFAIWSTFNMSNYEITEDIDVAFDADKVYVFGAYWQSDAKDFTELSDDMLTDIEQAGGKVLFNYADAQSLFGYVEAPDLTMITEWQSQQDFDQYYKDRGTKLAQAMKYSSELYLDIRE